MGEMYRLWWEILEEKKGLEPLWTGFADYGCCFWRSPESMLEHVREYLYSQTNN